MSPVITVQDLLLQTVPLVQKTISSENQIQLIVSKNVNLPFILTTPPKPVNVRLSRFL